MLVRRYVAAGMAQQAIITFDDMEAFVGREPNGEEFKMLLDTLCKYGYPKVLPLSFSSPPFYLLFPLPHFFSEHVFLLQVFSFD